jgi:hypothetical protein
MLKRIAEMRGEMTAEQTRLWQDEVRLSILVKGRRHMFSHVPIIDDQFSGPRTRIGK